MTGLSEKEQVTISLLRLNEMSPRREIRIKRRIGALEITFLWRSKKNLWGRFGGGWNWELGCQVGGSTVIINLLICSLRLSWLREVRYR